MTFALMLKGATALLVCGGLLGSFFFMVRRRLLGCPSRLDVATQRRTGAGETTITSGLGEGAGDDTKCLVLLSSCGEVCRESCPRFHALRQALQQTGIEENLLPVLQIESDLRQRNREIADIDNLDANPALAMRGDVAARKHTQADSITVDSTPKVDDAKHGAEQRDAERDSFACDGAHLFLPNSIIR